MKFDPTSFRRELSELRSTPAWESLAPPAQSQIYFPRLHVKALSPEVTVVEGMRGAGKSFWTACLADGDTRQFLARATGHSDFSNWNAAVGFGLSPDNIDFPTAQRLASLLSKGCSAYSIWKSVLLRHCLRAVQQVLPFADDVDAAALWAHHNPEHTDRLLYECDLLLEGRGHRFVLLFDSLERMADEWTEIRRRLTAALQLGLECRSRRAICCKFFLRPDMTERDDKIWHFAESSKLLLAKVELKWSPQDLYCLVMQQLANSRVGEDLRSHSLDLRWQPVDNVYPVPVRLASGQEQLLRSMVEALAGPWMGKDKKRGYTFTWIPTHLSDAQGRLSPRSILLAFQRAAEWTESNRPDYPLPLHYEGLHAGVVDASTNRVNELREDYPWVPPLLDALHGTSVPLTVNDLLTRWTEPVRSETLHAAREWQRLPPRRYSLTPSDPQALLADLVSLAVLYETSDARYNMPDIFRVGFGIKRRGGVKPPA